MLIKACHGLVEYEREEFAEKFRGKEGDYWADGESTVKSDEQEDPVVMD